MEKSRVFISYSHQDGACALGIARYLSRRGYGIWIDSEQLTLGQDWAESIDAALACADVMIAILSANAVRRPQVIREVGLAIDRLEREGPEHFRLFLVAVGPVHPSWFRGQEAAKARIIDYFSRYQFIQLNAHGDITTAAMKQLDGALSGSGILPAAPLPLQEPVRTAYVNPNGMPEKDGGDGSMPFYRVYSVDLAPSCVFPFALDNQWLPEQIGAQPSALNKDFADHGFMGPQVREHVFQYQRNNFFLSLLHSRQVILNRASILNSLYFRRIVAAAQGDEGAGAEKQAFRRLLEDGSIVVFLYGDHEVTPSVLQLPKYSTVKDAIRAWNSLCAETQMYCIRENWENPIDQHSIDLLRFCSTVAANADVNRMIAANLHLFGQRVNPFLAILKTIEMQVFCQTHMIGTGNPTTVNGYSRSAFYRDFVVKAPDAQTPDPVLNCVFDGKKPFHRELKKLIDIYYNSIFANYFGCQAQFPNDTPPEDTYLNSLFLRHGDKTVSIEELEYAFSELFTHCGGVFGTDSPADSLYLSNWDLRRVVDLRRSEEWLEYIELLEQIYLRSMVWQVDFSELERLADCYRRCFSPPGRPGGIRVFSFRLCIGSKVMDLVWNGRSGRMKVYDGAFSRTRNDTLTIRFFPEDITVKNGPPLIAVPILLFDGVTDSRTGADYFNELKRFFRSTHGFTLMA